MAKVVLLVNVELAPEKRDEYLATTGRLRVIFDQHTDVSYTVFENQGKDPNLFTEMFAFQNMDTYEAFDDNDDEETKDLFARITDLSKRSPRYTTMIEVE